jgi:signal transduction histidine kinase
MRPFKFSLTFAILASLAFLLVLTWILLSLISFKTAEQDLFSSKNEEGRLLLASFLNLLPARPLLTPIELTPADRFVARLAAEKDFAGLTLIDRQGRLVYQRGEWNSVDARLLATLRQGGESSAFGQNSRQLCRYAPLTDRGELVGAVRLTLSLAGEQAKLQRSRHIFLAYFLLDFLLLLGFGSYLLSRLIVVPVRKLLAATERITAGDYSYKAHVPGSREVAELARSFNVMVEALRTKQLEVATYVDSLEEANRELQAAREETFRSEKLASVGLLGAGMAHEIGTPLAAIIGYVDILRDELGTDRVKSDYLRRIGAEAERIDRIVRELLDYARPRQAQLEAVDVAALLAATCTMLEGQGVLKGIDANLAFEEGLAPVQVDRHQLQQVLINLIINARDAMPQGGTLLIKTSQGSLGEIAEKSRVGQHRVGFGRRREDLSQLPHAPLKGVDSTIPCVRIELSDSGSGIAPENLARIFDPFFTTKEPGKGTGLGLAICSRIIDSFGGKITVESAVGKGSRFVILLPLDKSGRNRQ